MPDLTPGRRPVGDSASAVIKLRRFELEIQVLRTDILRAEIEILDFEDQIQRRRDVIAANNAKMEEIAAKIAQAQVEEQPTTNG